MGDLRGHVTVEITRKNGDTEEIEVDGAKFTLEEERSEGDPDSMNNYCCCSLYKAWSQGIELQLTAVTSNTAVLEGPQVEVFYNKDSNIVKAEVTDCRIDPRSLLPPVGENGF